MPAGGVGAPTEDPAIFRAGGWRDDLPQRGERLDSLVSEVDLALVVADESVLAQLHVTPVARTRLGDAHAERKQAQERSEFGANPYVWQGSKRLPIHGRHHLWRRQGTSVTEWLVKRISTTRVLRPANGFKQVTGTNPVAFYGGASQALSF